MTNKLQEINFNIHNALKVRIRTNKHMDLCRDINFPYSYYETEQANSPDIILNIGEFKPQNDSCHIIDHKYYIKENYIYCSERVGKVTSKIEIIGIGKSSVVINVHSNLRHYKQVLFPDVLSQYFVLRPVIEYMLLLKGYLPIHAAAAANDNGAYVFLGRGGTYKTTLMMDYIRKMNYYFLGEDRVILNHNNVYCFPIHYKLFDYRINCMRTENYSFFDKGNYFKYQKLSRNKPQYIINKSDICSFFFINKSNIERISYKKISKKDAIAKTLLSQKMETISGPVIMGISKGLYDYFAAYSYVFPDSQISHYWEDYGMLLAKYINQDEFYEISLPLHYTESTFQDFTEIIQKLEKDTCKLETIPSTI